MCLTSTATESAYFVPLLPSRYGIHIIFILSKETKYACNNERLLYIGYNFGHLRMRIAPLRIMLTRMHKNLSNCFLLH